MKLLRAVPNKPILLVVSALFYDNSTFFEKNLTKFIDKYISTYKVRTILVGLIRFEKENGGSNGNKLIYINARHDTQFAT
jgi:hypothetical protein